MLKLLRKFFSLGTATIVAEAGNFTRATASAQIMSQSCSLMGIFVAAASATPTIQVWDSLSASGRICINTFTPAPSTFYPMPAAMGTGIFITISGTVDCTVFYTPNT
jgi:hypothetical protein